MPAPHLRILTINFPIIWWWWGLTAGWELVNHRRRIKTEEKAKVDAVGWGNHLNSVLTVYLKKNSYITKNSPILKTIISYIKKNH